MLLITGYLVAWTNVGDADLNDPDVVEVIRKRLKGNLRDMTASELEREVGDTEQIALMFWDGLPAGLSDKMLKSVRCLGIIRIFKPDFTE